MLGKCVVLAGLAKRANQSQDDSYINLYETFNFEPADFKVVATFLIKSSFSPHVVKGLRGRIVLEGVKTKEDADAKAHLLAKAYHTASHLRLDPLQEQCVNKLRMLPDIGSSALMAVMIYFVRAHRYGHAVEAEMEEWLVDRASGDFWKVVAEEGETFARMMGENIHMRMGVLERIAGVGGKAMVVEEDDQEEMVEDEGEEVG